MLKKMLIPLLAGCLLLFIEINTLANDATDFNLELKHFAVYEEVKGFNNSSAVNNHSLPIGLNLNQADNDIVFNPGYQHHPGPGGPGPRGPNPPGHSRGPVREELFIFLAMIILISFS